MLNLYRFIPLFPRKSTGSMFSASLIPAVSRRSRKPEGPVPSRRTSTFSAYTLPRKQLRGIKGALKPIIQKMCIGSALSSHFPLTSWYQFTGTECINFGKAAFNSDWRLKVILDISIVNSGEKGRGTTRQHSHTGPLLLIKQTAGFKDSRNYKNCI